MLLDTEERKRRKQAEVEGEVEVEEQRQDTRTLADCVRDNDTQSLKRCSTV